MCEHLRSLLVGTIARTSVAANIHRYSPLPVHQRIVPQELAEQYGFNEGRLTSICLLNLENQ
ncbi:hypothetical protein T11_5019 [Trichinella zimbabwensis]|uniref:Uncharacterized protein n=1 Tax=Trichinella zimbabwensis TaxID=268475 RepID=A0A0V1GAS3_9BILA|nr:hypothetical protein T11_5019 [Trichinella zimbabwensis]